MIADKGYSEPIHPGFMDRGVAPVTALRETERVKHGEHKAPAASTAGTGFYLRQWRRLGARPGRTIDHDLRRSTLAIFKR